MPEPGLGCRFRHVYATAQTVTGPMGRTTAIAPKPKHGLLHLDRQIRDICQCGQQRHRSYWRRVMKAHLRILLIPIGAAKLVMEVRVRARKTMAKSRTNEKVNIGKLRWISTNSQK